MPIQTIKIENYKSIKEIKIELKGKKLIPLIGINNVGKTNILEAINAIKISNKNNYNHYNPNNLNFRIVENNIRRENRNDISDDFSFEVKYSFTYKGESQTFLINKKKEISAILEQLVNKNIKICEGIVKKYFQNKYILQRNFVMFINALKLILNDPSGINILQTENSFPFKQNISFSNNIDDLQKSFKNFLLSNYVFSENEITNILDELSKFIETFNELKNLVVNFDFSNQIFYISTVSEVYDNFQIFAPIDLSQDLIEIKIYNNYLSALIYFNEDYENILVTINSLLNNKKQVSIENMIEKANEILKEKFWLKILYQDDENYIIYPEFYISNNNDKSFLYSNLVLIRKNKEKEYNEPISLISQGLRNKLILKLNLEYCKKYSDKEIILLLDEPDQGLYINAILQLYEELKEITETTQTKIIYTTHSPYLLGHIFETYQDILIVEKDQNNKTIFTKEFHNITYQELKDTALEKMLPITGNDYLIMNAMNCRNFRYVTVEGKTDYSFFNWYNKNYFKKNLYFVVIHGKDKIKLINYFKNINLKYISLYDNDFKREELKAIKYQDVFPSELAIKDLESLLKNNKNKHSKCINKNDTNKLDNYYQKLLENPETEKNVKDLFTYLDQKFGELND